MAFLTLAALAGRLRSREILTQAREQMVCQVSENWTVRGSNPAEVVSMRPPGNCSDSILPLARKMVLSPMRSDATSQMLSEADAQRTVLEFEKRNEQSKERP